MVGAPPLVQLLCVHMWNNNSIVISHIYSHQTLPLYYIYTRAPIGKSTDYVVISVQSALRLEINFYHSYNRLVATNGVSISLVPS